MHLPLTLAKDVIITDSTKKFIRGLFESNKSEFFTGDARRTITIAQELAEKIIVQEKGMERSALTW